MTQEKSKVVHRGECPREDCGSSTGYVVFDSGNAYCHKCGHKTLGKGKVSFDSENQIKEDAPNYIRELGVRGLKHRKISRDVAEFFDCRAEVDSKNNPVVFYIPWGESDPIGYQCKDLVTGRWSYTGRTDLSLFGQRKFNRGGKRVVVTEGAWDAMAVAQAFLEHYKTIYPVVAVQSASSEKLLLHNKDWLRSFDEVVLYLDNDEPGRKLRDQAVKILGYSKVKLACIPKYKDANEALIAENYMTLLKAVWDASPPPSPVDVVSLKDRKEKIREKKEIQYIPFPPFMKGVNDRLFGRVMGSITMFFAGTSIGKSAIINEDIYHLLTTTDLKIGVVSPEKSEEEFVEDILSLHFNKRLQVPGVKVSEQEWSDAYDKLFGSDRVFYLIHAEDATAGDIESKLDYMALRGCKAIYVDHITIIVSEVEDTSDNKAIDITMNMLLRLCRRHELWVGLISHVRKVSNGYRSFEQGTMPTEDDLKGSGSLKQIPAQNIAMARNKIHPDEKIRNTTYFMVHKARRGGDTGFAGAAYYNRQTGRLEYVESSEYNEGFEKGFETEIVTDKVNE
jgi:twinkle protein